MSESQEIAVAETQPGTAVASVSNSRFTHDQIEKSSLNDAEQLPDLSQYNRHFMSLETEYWTPEVEGEEKLCWVMGVGYQEMTDMSTGELKNVECVMLAERHEDKVKRFIVAGKIFVANIKAAVQSGVIIPNSTLTPIAIVYKGEKKNKNNAFKSKRWEITPIII